MTLLSEDLRAQLASGQAVIVAGAGVSLSATGGAPLAGWSGLLEDGIARCAEIAEVPDGWDKVQRETLGLGDIESWLAVAEQVTIRLGGRPGGEFRRWLHETVGTLQIADGGRGLLDALVGLGVPICTTNYDGLIDEVADVDAVTWRDGPRAQMVLRGDDTGIIHLHGHWRDPESVILGVRSYGDVLANGSAQAMLRALGTMRSLVLVGFGAGLDDPNFGALRAWMAQTWPDSEYRHYRLVSESERAAVLAAGHGTERIQPIVYGDDYGDLQGFLRGLATDSKGPRRHSAPADVPRAAIPHLPAPRPFFGREDLVGQVVDAVLDVDPAPVPVLGPPGIGKSALTQAGAHDPRVAARFGARRFWVRCDSAETAASVAAEIAFALGISGADAPEAAAIAALATRPALLLLDNAETPWEADLPGTEELLSRLAAVPGLALVCSFRGGQRPIGPQWHDSITVPPLRSTAAAQVFLAAAGQQFADDPALAGLLSDLDGMPIAIELLGRLAQPENDLEGLRRRWEQHRTDLLEAGSDPDRYRSVAISFDLSIANPRLPERARRMLSVLAHLPDGVAIAELDLFFENGESAAAELRQAGLSFEEASRLRVLKPIRDHVAAHYEAPATDLRRTSEHYLNLAQTLGPKVGKADGARAASHLAEESGNLTFIINHALDGDAVVEGIDAALSLTDVGRYKGLPVDHLTRGAIRRAGEIGDRRREARALLDLGRLTRSDHEGAREALEPALGLYRQIGDVLGEAECIKSLGDIALQRSDHAAAGDAFQRALPLYRQAGSILGEANCVESLGEIALRRSDYETARKAYEQALPLHREAGSILGETNCVASLGDLALRRSDYETARKAYEQALPLYRQTGSILGEANCIKCLGDIALQTPDHEAAGAVYEQALALYRQIGDVLGEANCIRRLGDVALQRPDLEAAGEAYERALPLYRQCGDILGEANCIRSLGNIELARFDHDAAREAYEQALALYTSIAEPYSIGMTHVRLIQVSNPDEAAHHQRRAEEVWLSIDRNDLVEHFLADDAQE